MRIQHNIMAMNSYRNYSAVRGSLGKNLEKLSSGYKINRAGDDAAGLAISEKMRAQITGLTAAQKNVKDGISLVKTAEGAMQEIQDMLNRMDYLAPQSANGTYQDEIDRENLQKEVVNLKREIDRIAESANFNGIKLLDGSLKGGGEDVFIPGTPGKPADPGTPDQIIPGKPGKPGRPPSWTTPPVEEVKGKKGTFAVKLSEIKGESDDAEIEIAFNGVTKNYTFKDNFNKNLTVSAQDLAVRTSS